ncbi:TPA: hemagglutinin, partial [Acinetobacter baumannii]|nr:hemagglutinin [Acinetobacter baumannii]
NEFKNKYMVKINYPILGEPPILINLMDGSPFSADYVFSFKYDDNYLNDVKRNELFYKSNLNGSEHSETKLNSKNGNINVTSAKGLSISGGNISAQLGQVNLEASGILAEQYKSTTITESNPQPRILNASIIIDGHTDFYDKGNENDDNYSMRTLVSPTIINGDKGVNIRTVGKTKDDNLVLQATGITSKNGDVKIESNKSILFDAAVEQSYDRTTTTEKKKSWGGLKKKYITTVAENNDTNAASVDISGKNIFIETKKLDPSVDVKNPDNNIDIYSGRFTADGGKITINSGGNLNFYTVEESSDSNVDITKKSTFAGIKYNTSKTNATRTQVTELPATLKADYIGTKSGFDTRLVGTEFEYLKDATIEAGGKLDFIAAKTSITDLVKKEKNSVVWQSMQDKGSITETAQLPSFNGPVLPTFKAAGGLSVQVPISEKDANKVELRDEILKLANQPGNAYLKELVNRKDVDWQTVLLTQKDWDYKSQGLTAAGAALIVIIVTIATMGSGTAAAAGAAGGTAASGTTVGLGASMIGSAGITTTAAGAIVPSTLGAMANAAITSLATQASVGLINNGGDIGKTLKDLGSKDSIKNLAASVVTAGLMSQVGSALNLKPDSTLLPDRLANNFASSVGSTLVQTAIKGGDLGDNLQVALLAGLAGALQGELAQNLKGLEDVNYILHKIAHAAVGCAAAAATKQSCEAGAIGAGVGEIIAQEMLHGRNPTFVSAEEKAKIEAYSKLIAGTISAYAGYDVNTAANSATIAIQNNAFKDKALLKLEATRKYLDDKSKAALDGLINAYKKGDIEAAKKFKNQLDDSVTTWANSSSSYLNIETKSALGEIVIVVSDLVIPTNYVEILPVGKLSKVAKILKIGEDGTKSAGRLAEELAELQKVDIKFGKTLPGAKAPITVTAESNIGGKHMFDTNQTARPEVNRTNTPTLAAGNAKIDPSNPNLTMKNAHAEIALIQRAYDAGLTKGETMQVLVRGKEVCDHCGQVMKT